MPITVQHGIPASPGLINLALAAGRQPARPSGVIGGGAVGGAGVGVRGMDPMGDQAALEAFYGRQAQEQAYQQEVGILQEQAQVEAEMFEYKYSAKQKQELAQLNNAERLLAGPEYSDEDRAQFGPMLRAKRLGLGVKEVTFRDPNKPVYPEGQGPTDAWEGPDGGFYTRADDGSWKLLVQPRQTFKYREMELQAEERKAERESQQKYEDAIQASRSYWTRQTKKKVGEEGVGTIETSLEPDEIEERMRAELPRYAKEQEAREAEAELITEQEQREKREQQEFERVKNELMGEGWKSKPRELIAASKDLRRTEEDAGLPEFVAMAQAFMRYIGKLEEREGRVPAHFQPAIVEAHAVMALYDEGRGI